MTAPVSTPFGLRAYALDALLRADRQARQMEQEMLRCRRANLSATFKTRLLRLLNFDGIPLTDAEQAYLDQHWFASEGLEPDALDHERRISHVNDMAPVCIIDGIMIAPTYNAVLVGTWHDGEPPTELTEITGLADLGRWCAAREQEDAIDAVPTERDDVQ